MLSSGLVGSVLESAPDAMVIIDRSGKILFANRQVTELFGYAPEEIIGREVELLLPERFRGRHVGHREHFAANVRFRPMGSGLDLFARRKDGSEYPVEISLSPVYGGERTLFAAAIRDVSDRKRVEAELVAAREAADRANKAKSRFLAAASHDLRQPLQTLALLNGTLRRSVGAGDAAEAVAQQERAISAMSRLLNSLLDISKLESGAVKPEPTDFTVAALFDELRQEFARIAADKGVELRVESCGDGVRSDPALVGQILRNLLSNAIKYTQAGWVRLACVHLPARVRIEVQDSGIGIPAECLPYIYDEFYQVGAPANAARGGYGLGLSIVQRLVRLLDLRLEVVSEPGRGSLFALELPASAAAAGDTVRMPLPPVDSPHEGRRTVLLVEDDPNVRDATRMLLKVEGYRVLTAGSLDEARAKAREETAIDLLITDYHLSRGETGTQVIEALREARRPHLGAVLVTGDTSTAIRELPRDERLRLASKPIDADELLSVLKGLLEG